MENKIPKDWKWVKLRDLTQKINKIKRKEVSEEEELLYLDIGGIDNSLNKIVTHKNYLWKNAPSRAQQIVEVKDILFSTVRTYMKNIAIVDKAIYQHQVASSGFTVIRTSKAANYKYIFYLTISDVFLNPLNELQTGSSYPAVRDSDVLNQKVPLPPLETQQAIVSKIEELFSELDKGIEDLKTAQQQLKTYRQSVLKWAFEGKLTNENVKEGELPKGWQYTTLGSVCELKAGNFVKASEIEDLVGEKLFRCYGGNGLRGFTKTFTHEGIHALVGRQGALCGNVHLVDGKFHATEHAVVVSTSNSIDMKCLYYKLKQMRLNQYSSGVAQPGLSVNKLLPIEISFPLNIKEQHQIVQEIESRLSVSDKMEESIAQSLQQAEALRQSILKKAFSGELV